MGLSLKARLRFDRAQRMPDRPLARLPEVYDLGR